MTTDPQWSPCEPGTLDSLRQKPSSLTRRGALAAVVMAAAGGGLLLLRRHEPGGISCAQVAGLARDYVDGRLNDELSQQIETHRGSCTACDQKIEHMEQQRDQSA